MTIKYPMPEGNTDETMEFLDRMFPGLSRHLVAIDHRGRVRPAPFPPTRSRKPKFGSRTSRVRLTSIYTSISLTPAS